MANEFIFCEECGKEIAGDYIEMVNGTGTSILCSEECAKEFLFDNSEYDIKHFATQEEIEGNYADAECDRRREKEL